MRVIMLSWEYPPMRVGGIAAALEGLAPALARAGIEVHVVTCGASGGDAEEEQAPGLFIHRVNVEGHTHDFIHWVHLLNFQMEARANALIEQWAAEPKSQRKPILLHVHDWLGYFSGRSLKYRHHLPLLCTIHATEFGRNNGIHTEMQRYINQIEWELQFESWRVIVCSKFMRGEVMHALSTPYDKVDVIYNGVDPTVFDFPFPDDEREAFRARFALPFEKIVFFIGRMVREKGAQVLVQSLPEVRARCGDVKLIIAGGGYRNHLEDLARSLNLGDAALFTGRISDHDRDRLYRVADAAVYPSLYEPFGIVALEAMAAHVPVVVSEAGGLAEVVEHDVTGTTTYVEDAHSLAWGISRVLNEPDRAQDMADAAYDRVLNVFNWDRIAGETAAVYHRIWGEYTNSDWAQGSPLFALAKPVKRTAPPRPRKKAVEATGEGTGADVAAPGPTPGVTDGGGDGAANG